MNKIMQIYKELKKMYGPQGWWPLIECKGTNPTKTGCIKGYHPGDHSYPKNDHHVFEICLGAILTQNTSWPSVEKALLNLKRSNALSVKGIKRLSDGKLRELIKCAGYYNQKSRYIREFTDFFEQLKGRAPARKELLDINGIGPETADSMLLYAFRVPTFVIDAYTRRIFHRLGFIGKKADYHEIKALFEENIRPGLAVYQEYHALIVEHAKRHYAKKPYGKDCPLKHIRR